jgi:hypothetical protein
VLVPCDTLAANWIGGFKEGVGFAHKACRTCNATQDEMKQMFQEKNFKMREEIEHRERCDLLESNLSPAARKYWSRQWGINRRSCLQDIDDCKLCTILVHDPMHIFMEGIVPYELKHMLSAFIFENKYFTVKWLNNRIRSFPYTYLEANAKPEVIEQIHLVGEGKLRQTSAGIMTLVVILPYIVAEKVPEEETKWQNFLRLIQIMLLSTSPCCTKTTAAILTQLIIDHHKTFVHLYPNASIIPKMHYCVHLPTQLLQFGPLRNQWCLRFEAKHGFFKGKKWRCFKNLPLSIATKHQKYTCWAYANNSDGYLYEGDIVKEGFEAEFIELYPALVEEMTLLTSANDIIVYSTPGVKIHGHEFRPGCCVVLGYQNDMPSFAIVTDILVYNDEKYFVVETMEIESFEQHVISYIITSNIKTVISYKDLFSKWPLSIHKYKGRNAVINKYSHTCEIF